MDLLIHVEFLGKASGGLVPAYSSNDHCADEVKARLKTRKDAKIVVGRSKLRDRRWFARHEKDPSTGTEVMAETYPLAICRLALLIGPKTN